MFPTPRQNCLLTLSVLVLFAAQAIAEESPQPIDYMRQIRPILSQNCFSCHGPDESSREAGLRLDQREGALALLDSGSHAIKPGDLKNSELWNRVTTEDESLKMPPLESGRKLTAEQVELVRRWIEQQAPYAEHWSFRPVTRPEVPAVKDSSWPNNEIDHFVLARLEQQNIKPSPAADRVTLIRRLSLDLTGLPPTPQEVRQFVNDDRPDAYEQLVDRLLQSPHFGERFGRHWLDLARYADSDGYLGDDLRPYAWMYRDWVIDAINRDMPFDEFTTHQIAGDLLPEATLEQKIATGFHRGSMKNTEAGADRELDRVQRTVDRISTVGTVWLGLTVGCAECHAHKFDPISHAEFYQMYAFFNQLEDVDLPAAPPDVLERYERERGEWQAEVNTVKKSLRQVIERVNQSRGSSELFDTDAVLTILRAAEAKRKPEQQTQLKTLYASIDADQRKLFERYEHLARTMPDVPAMKAPTVGDTSKKRATHVHLRGDFRSPGEEVEPGTLGVLHPLKPRGETADRLDLARWLVDPANPLTPRTTVNHFWKHLFGRGLVDTMGDFGATGTRLRIRNCSIGWRQVFGMRDGAESKSSGKSSSPPLTGKPPRTARNLCNAIPSTRFSRGNHGFAWKRKLSATLRSLRVDCSIPKLAGRACARSWMPGSLRSAGIRIGKSVPARKNTAGACTFSSGEGPLIRC